MNVISGHYISHQHTTPWRCRKSKGVTNNINEGSVLSSVPVSHDSVTDYVLSIVL